MSDRVPVRSRLRFEVFKRDKFTCQYCGKKAPDVVLHVDHIQPVVAGGANDLLNLVAACVDCNLGKGPRTLSDASVVEKQRQQLEELQDRREQQEMMLEWQVELVLLESDSVAFFRKLVARLWPGVELSDVGAAIFHKALKHLSMEDVSTALREVTNEHRRMSVDGQATEESFNVAFVELERKLHWAVRHKLNPVDTDARYLRGCLINSLPFISDNEKELAFSILYAALSQGWTRDDLKPTCVQHRKFSEWRNAIRQIVGTETWASLQ
jgi:hypothetical protein